MPFDIFNEMSIDSEGSSEPSSMIGVLCYIGTTTAVDAEANNKYIFFLIDATFPRIPF